MGGKEFVEERLKISVYFANEFVFNELIDQGLSWLCVRRAGR